MPLAPALSFSHPGSSQRRPPPWALHLPPAPALNFSQPASEQRCPPPWAMHLPLAPWLSFSQPGSSQRRPPPWGLHLPLAPALDFSQPGSMQRRPPLLVLFLFASWPEVSRSEWHASLASWSAISARRFTGLNATLLLPEAFMTLRSLFPPSTSSAPVSCSLTRLRPT